MSGLNSAGWKEVINKEFDLFFKSKIWEFVFLYERRKIISIKWVCRTEYKADGSLEKLKVRLVVKGCS